MTRCGSEHHKPPVMKGMRYENRTRKRRQQKDSKKTGRKNLIFRLCKTIFHYFPDLYDKIREIEDCRKKKVYEPAELIMAVS